MFSFIRLDYIRNDYLTSVLKNEKVYKILLEKQDRKKGGKNPRRFGALGRHAEMRTKCSNIAIFSLSEEVASVRESNWGKRDLMLTCWQPFMESKISLDAKLKQSELQSVPELERTYKLVDHSHNLIIIDKEVYVINTIGYCGRTDDLDLRYCSYLFCYDISDKSFHVKASFTTESIIRLMTGIRFLLEWDSFSIMPDLEWAIELFLIDMTPDIQATGNHLLHPIVFLVTHPTVVRCLMGCRAFM